MTFDTLAVANELKQAGFSQEQAEALARAWGHVASGDLATKSDLIRTESALKEDIATVKSDLEKQIATLKSDLEQKIAGLDQKIARLDGRFTLLSWMVGVVMALCLAILGKLLIIHP